MENKFTQRARRVLTLAMEQAQELGHSYIGSEHLLLGMLAERECTAARLLTRHGVTHAGVLERLAPHISASGGRTALGSADLTPRARRIIEASSRLGERSGQALIGTEHLLYSLLCEDDCLAVRLIEQSGIPLHELQSDALNLIRSPSRRSAEGSKKRAEGTARVRGALEFARDLTALARDGGIDPTLCREAETERVIRILCRRKKNNPCLIGEPGVGKTAIAEGLALSIAEGRVPSSLADRVIYALDLPSMVAGAKYRGEFEERMRELISECAADPRVILFIDELHTIIGAGGAEGAIDAANILKPALARGEIRIIGATTLTEYRRYIERDPALERRFQPVSVREPSIEDARRILLGLRERYEEHHRLRISDGAIDASLSLSVRYIHDRYLPDKAIDLIDEAAARVRLTAASEKILGDPLPPVVDGEDVAAVVTDWTGIPTSTLMKSESERLLGLEGALGERIIGQDDAIRAVADAIRRGRMGLGLPNRPVGSFLFAGPSGVGKTELCAVLSELLLGSRDSLLRFDMSEYMEKHSVSRLIGSPPGYVGYGEGGALTEGVHRNPYCIVLFDEIEKAHPEVFDLLLQILEDGVLTDSQGRKVSFADTIVILTSNLGTARGGSELSGFCPRGDVVSLARERERRVRSAIRDTFRPELLSRIDEIVVFNSLTHDDLTRICDLMLRSLSCRLSERGIELSFTPEVCELLTASDATELGARALRQSIRRTIENPLSALLLSEDLTCGAEVHVDVGESGGGVRFSVNKKIGEPV